jgi:HlyD family secretion protein
MIAARDLALFAMLSAAVACDAPPGVKAAVGSEAAAPSRRLITARGRLEPRDGLRRIAGPGEEGAVVGRLLVDEGDRVAAGQVLAELDVLPIREASAQRALARVAVQEAAVVRLGVEHVQAESEERRQQQLRTDGISAVSVQEEAKRKVEAAAAALRGADAELLLARAEKLAAFAERDRAIVRAPHAGQVVKVHARQGERVGADGILELARNDAMYAIAEVYETDVARVRAGLKAAIRSAALRSDVRGTVERVGLKVGKLDALGTDPAARTDARVVEVRVRLDDGTALAGLTNLEVDVLIEPE